MQTSFFIILALLTLFVLPSHAILLLTYPLSVAICHISAPLFLCAPYQVVDVQIRAELENLQAALQRDERGKRTKKSIKKKARRSGKKSKKKKDKDLTPDRSTESLFEELIENDIIRNYPFTPISSFIGETSCVVHQNQNISAKYIAPSLGDVRQVIQL